MDVGHYNCRDYYVSPHFAPTTLASLRISDPTAASAQRHESFDELEQRARSPASAKPKFPLLRLPLELRQQILRHLLPRTRELVDTSSRSPAPSRIVWQRGEIALFGVCRQLHDLHIHEPQAIDDFMRRQDYHINKARSYINPCPMDCRYASHHIFPV